MKPWRRPARREVPLCFLQPNSWVVFTSPTAFQFSLCISSVHTVWAHILLLSSRGFCVLRTTSPLTKSETSRRNRLLLPSWSPRCDIYNLRFYAFKPSIQHRHTLHELENGQRIQKQGRKEGMSRSKSPWAAKLVGDLCESFGRSRPAVSPTPFSLPHSLH